MNESAAAGERYESANCKHGFQAACLDPATLRPTTGVWRPGAPWEACGYCAFFQKAGGGESSASEVESESPFDADRPHTVRAETAAALRGAVCDGCGQPMATGSPEAALEKEIAAHRRMTEDDASVARVCVARIATLAAEPITPRSMLLIERFVKIAREAWAIEKGVFFEDRGCGVPYGQLGSGMNDPLVVGPASFGFNPGVAPVAPVYLGQNLGNAGLGPIVNPLGPMMPAAAGAAENFGVTAIRELVSAFSAKKPEEVVRAIAAAKELGLHDLALRLEASLGVAPSGVVAAVPPGSAAV